MINLSLPIRPRREVRSEYLTTPVSVLNSDSGSKVLCLTKMNIKDDGQLSEEYINTLSEKVGTPDYVFSDSDKDFLLFFEEVMARNKNLLSEKIVSVLTCQCGKYEELAGIRNFNQRRVKENICTYCQSELELREVKSLFLKMDWAKVKNYFNFSHKKKWNKVDFEHFIGRQNFDFFKISKTAEPTKFSFNDHEYGIKHQIVWAILVLYISNELKDSEIKMHAVDRVSDLAFLTASIAEQVTEDKLTFNFEPLPTIWLPQEIRICDASNEVITAIKTGLNSTRKEIKVDLPKGPGGFKLR